MYIDFLRSLVRIRLVGSFFISLLLMTLFLIFMHFFGRLILYFFVYYTDVHCGVVGNIQAFHVCAPGSIPGDGVFIALFIFPRLTLTYSIPLRLFIGYRP